MLDRYFSVLEKKRFALHHIAASSGGGVACLEAVPEEELAVLNRAGTEGVRTLALERAADMRLERFGGPSVLEVKVEFAHRLLKHCCLCERRCGVDRTAGGRGYCGVSDESRYCSEFLHMGEEPELIPSHTVFFAGCTFRCAYCQNWDIAMSATAGRPARPADLAAVLLEGLSQGSRNANFVGGNPDPNLRTILETVRLAGRRAEFLPMVWNSNMYTSAEAMELLDGVIDIYLGDFRYGNDACARELSDVDDYFAVVTRNFASAFESAEVMLRHLVLPGHLECCTRPVMEWAARNMPGVYFNLMFQYRPVYRAGLHPDIDRRLSAEEMRAAGVMAVEYGLATG